MKGISKTIERVKEFHKKWENEYDPKAEKVLNDLNKIYFANVIMSIITAYEQSQKELEWVQGRLGPVAKERDLLIEESAQRAARNTELKSDLDTANKRIAELEDSQKAWLEMNTVLVKQIEKFEKSPF